jgi:mono/diheme cytochrome c family protein
MVPINAAASASPGSGPQPGDVSVSRGGIAGFLQQGSRLPPPGNRTMLITRPPESRHGAWLLGAIAAVITSLGGTASAASPEQAFSDASQPLVRAFLTANCLECHAAKEPEAGVRLDDLPFEITTVQTAEHWQKVLDVLNSGEMPPERKPRPHEQAKTEVLAALSRALVVARRTLGDQGRVSLVRRLNRREYRHTLRDLLGIDLDAAGVDTSSLPDDTGTAAFDTIGSGLFMSSDQLEQYLAIGRAAIEAAASDWPQPGAPKPERKTERREAELQARKQIEGLYNGYFLGGYTKAKEWEASGGKPPKDFGFPDEHEAKFRILQHERHGPYLERFLQMPHADTGAYLMYASNNHHDTESIAIPAFAPPGDYVLRVRVGAAAESPPLRRFLEFGLQTGKNDEQSDFRALDVFQVTGTIDQPQVIEIPVRISGHGPRTWHVREKRYNDDKADSFRHALAKAANGVGLDHALWIDWVEWEGPLPRTSPSPIRAHVFDGLAAKGQELDLAKTILRRFGKFAFRGATPSADFLEQLVAVYKAKRDAGAPPIEAIREPMAVILASPGFLYLADPLAQQAAGTHPEEPADNPASRRLSPRELATRLSYFLWSAPPDDELLALVASGELTKPDILAKQVDRLLAHEKSRDFAAGFAHQWLGLDRLEFFRFDYELFPDFDEATREVSKHEVYETFHTLVSGNLDARKLLASDFVVVNGLMAAYYGLDDGGGPVIGDDFRIVKLPTDSPRGGLLGMAAILAMGSNGERTSPVERGAWVLRKLMHDPPPPAPANVPQLTRLESQQITTRERLRMHQEQAQCAQCHRVIDPIGYGLENFDAAGRWRAEEHFYGRGWVVKDQLAGKVVRKSWPIEPAGALHNGPAFHDFFELRQLIATRHGDAFARGLIENLFAYALGRPVSFADAETLDTLATSAKADQYHLRTIIHRIVSSEEFQTK